MGVKKSVHPSENHLGKKIMTTAKLFSLVIVSLLIGEIENLMVADPESSMVKPVVQPLVHSLVQAMVQPINQLMVQPMFQYPHLVVIPSHGNNNRFAEVLGIMNYKGPNSNRIHHARSAEADPQSRCCARCRYGCCGST